MANTEEEENYEDLKKVEKPEILGDILKADWSEENDDKSV